MKIKRPRLKIEPGAPGNFRTHPENRRWDTFA
jgi:hypothetical protein